eukprot:4824137-Prymnesium_polylepis.1
MTGTGCVHRIASFSLMSSSLELWFGFRSILRERNVSRPFARTISQKSERNAKPDLRATSYVGRRVRCRSSRRNNGTRNSEEHRRTDE